MKRILLVMLAGCLMLAVGCKKENELDRLANTKWESENTNAVIAHGAVYYGDGSYCRELIEFDQYGFAERYYTHNGEKIKYLGGSLYTVNGSTLIIEKDTAHTYTIIDDNNIISYYATGNKDGEYKKIQ